jgi:hypothetical protein
MQRRLQSWRERCGGPGQPIPQGLWDEAVAVARVEGIDATARALRMDRGRLARRMELVSSSPESSPVEAVDEADAFVEVDARGLCAPTRTVLRFEGRDGKRLHIELSDASALNVADLARAFWSRAR